MTEITYKIKFFSDWHCGSGLGAGAETDAEVIKDSTGLSYVPGKTIKGLLKDACQEISDVQNEKISQEIITSIFGFGEENNSSIKGNAFFSNAKLPKVETGEIISNNLQQHLFRNIASTAIGENGIAQKNSLRVMEVSIPITLEGSIEVENDEQKEAILLALKWVRHLGTNRNRGLGRCQFITPKEENQ